MFKTAIAAATLGALAIATPAMAGPTQSRTTTVSFADLDLTTAAGQERLDRRIDYAARQICGVDDIRTGTRIKSLERKRCHTKAVKSAKTQVAAQIEARHRGG